MDIFREIAPLRAYLEPLRLEGKSLGFVPTMGALHEGHMELVRRSLKENDVTIASIFVNPAQFNNPDDLKKYPRNLERDFELLKANHCDVVFCPPDHEMYPDEFRLKFDFDPIDKILEGEFRPGHFSGVALVVSKLFNIVTPTRAYFGQKDYQQFLVVSRLVREMKFDISLICVPIVREADGLALSSRNSRLTAEERKRAVVFHQCLQLTRQGLLNGKTLLVLKNEAEALCKAHNARIEYLSLADRENLGVKGSGKRILLIAGYISDVRLIDNLFID